MIILAQLAQGGSTETNSTGSIIFMVALGLVVLGLLSKKRR